MQYDDGFKRPIATNSESSPVPTINMTTHAVEYSRVTNELPPCVVVTHPVNDRIVVVGTYKLDEDGSRQGSVDVYTIDEYNNYALALSKSTNIRSAVLDLKFVPNNPSLLVTAQSCGMIVVWQLSGWEETRNSGYANRADDDDDGQHTAYNNTKNGSANSTHGRHKPVVNPIGHYELFDKSSLVLSVNFAYHDKSLLSATLSSGEVALIKMTDSGDLKLLAMHNTHTLESWTSTFGGVSELNNILFSGGDDSILAAHDIRTMSQTRSGLVWTSMRLHDAGITSILGSSPHWMTNRSTHTLWTGGYDDKLVSVDLRLGPSNALDPYVVPRVESSMNLGGGVWRLVPRPWSSYSGSVTDVSSNEVLACCMYGGARVVAPTAAGSSRPATVVRTIEKGHDSMVYGGDWIAEGSKVVTCSFYDKQVVVWGVDVTR